MFKELFGKGKIKSRYLDRKRWKKNGRKILKKHYKLFIALLVAAALFGTSYSASLSGINLLNASSTTVDEVEDVENQYGLANNMTSYLLNHYENSKHEETEKLKDEFNKGSKIGIIEMGRSQGVFAKLVNSLSSGQILISMQKAIGTITHSKSISDDLFVIIGFIFIFIVWTFFIHIYEVVYKRMFLEARIYEKVPFDRISYLVRVKKWFKASITMLVMTIYLTIWQFTIIGSIKKFSYFATPYIVAENPSLSAKEAITLSRKMMNGHKWECFMLSLSFFLWDLLGTLTLGWSELLFTNAYREATLVEFYYDVRKAAILNHVEGIEVLKDTYLFEKADPSVIDEAYQDVLAIMNEPIPEIEQRKGIRYYLESLFGLVLYEDQHEKEFRRIHKIQHEKENYQDIIALKAYPRRLDPILEKDKKEILESTEYYRHYSLASIIMIFFSVSFIGWLWEVSLHLVEDGKFVNRGIMYGPWLPIYGSGGIIILLLLYRLRNKPVHLFGSTLFVCGVVEYYSSYFMEVLFDKRWWDYSGYFLNINGRICAEGLLVFGIGGFVIVYFLAPMLDNQFHKLSKKHMQIIVSILLLSFISDSIYSSYHPNEGKGITDYQTVENNSSNS